jgi:hypothetical protein
VIDPYVLAFVALLAAYCGYSLWARLDPRLPIGAALVLLLVAAIVDAAQDLATANVLAEFVILLLGAGILLLLLEHARDAGRRPRASGASSRDAETTDPAQEGDRTAEQSLDRAEQQAVPFVDASGEQHHDEEQAGDPETDHGQAP